MIIQGLLQNNPIFSGGLALGLMGGILASLRAVPGKLWDGVKRQVILSAEIRSDDALFYWFKYWLHQQASVKASRSVSASTHWTSSDDDSGQKLRIVFTPAPGEHLIRYKGKMLWMSREVHENAGGFGGPTEKVVLKCLGRDQTILRTLFKEVEAVATSVDNNHVSVWIPDGSSWTELVKKNPRYLDSVILPEGIAEEILTDLSRFNDSGEWYSRRGLPYRRGYLFYGPPGSGKSSLVSALAGEMRKDLYVLNIGSKGMDDTTVSQLMMKIPPKGFLLIEDVDAAFSQRDKADEHASHVTFSGLLNALDGVGAKDGQIVFLSTNHIEKLDPALIRPGRVDYRLLLGNPDRSQARRLFDRFFPDSQYASFFAQKAIDKGLSMAALQSHLLSNRDDASAAYESL